MGSSKSTKTFSESSDLLTVLYADEDPDFDELTAQFLKGAKDQLEVPTATHSNDRLVILRKQDIDCIVSDYDISEQDGIEFLRTVREEYPDLSFILYTGRGSEEVASEAISEGVTDYPETESGSDPFVILMNLVTHAVEGRAMLPLTPSRDHPPSANEDVARLRLWLRHLSVRELEMQGIVDWDRDENVVKKGSRFDTKWDDVPR